MRGALADGLFWQALAVFLMAGALSGVVLGLSLVVRPQLVQGVNRIASRWISARIINRFFDRSISVEYWIYRRHRILGAFIVCGAVYGLAHFGLWFDRAPSLARLAGLMPPEAAAGLLDALVLIALTGGAFALWAGLLLWLRPSMLRNVEAVSNRWISTRRLIRALDVPRGHVDRFVLVHARRAGWLLMLASCVLAILLLRLFLR